MLQLWVKEIKIASMNKALEESSQGPRTAQLRGRPRGFDRTKALDKAMRIFWRKGYASTSISDLTSALGIGSTSLYAAFGSKEALYAEALQYYLGLFESRVWSRFAAAPTARAAVEALLIDTADFVGQSAGEGNPLGCMTTHSVTEEESGTALSELMLSLRVGMFDRILKRLDEAVGKGELRRDLDTRAMTRLIITFQNGMSVQARAGVPPSELKDAAKEFMVGWRMWSA